MIKLVGPNRATFAVVDTAGVASIELDGTPISSSAITGVTAGTVSASKAVIVDANKDVTGFRNVTATSFLTTKASVAATGNDTTQTATVTTYAGIITTGALTTAANAATSVVLTLTGLAAGSIVQVCGAGGTNTTPVYVQSAVATLNTITVVLRNGVNATTALNGTVAFSYVVVA